MNCWANSLSYIPRYMSRQQRKMYACQQLYSNDLCAASNLSCWYFSFPANLLACFPISSATCSIALWLVNWLNIILTTLSLLCMHVSNFIAMTCVPPLICLVGIFSFAANQLACFPTRRATCSMALWLVNWFNVIATTLSILCLNIIIPLTIMNFELSSIVYSNSLS